MFSHILSVQLCCTCVALVTKQQPPVEQIPQQIIFTGWADKVDDLKAPEKANIMNVLNLNPGFRLRYLGDVACHSYLYEFFASDPDLARLPDFYKHEKMGMRRGDICRAAVLFREGGHYVDLDMVAVAPISDVFVHGQADFVGSMDSINRAFNAFQAGPKGHPILKKSLKFLATRYAAGDGVNEDLGVLALADAIKEFQTESCQSDLFTEQEIHNCGPHRIIMFKEKQCTHVATGCPSERKGHYAEFGVYDGDRVMVWSRFPSCHSRGCEMTGSKSKSHFSMSSQKLPSFHEVGAHGKFGFTAG